MYRRNIEPDYEAALGLIKHLESDALRDLVNNDESVDNLVKNAQQCKDLETSKEILMAENKSLAEYNLSLSPKLENGKEKLKELSDEIQSLCDVVQEKQNRLRSHSGNVNGETALALLQTAAAECEEQSEEIAEKLYRKELEIEEFLEQFETVRKQMHMRRVKADKLKELLSNKKNMGVGNAVKKPAPAVPYPVGPSFMPRLPQ